MNHPDPQSPNDDFDDLKEKSNHAEDDQLLQQFVDTLRRIAPDPTLRSRSVQAVRDSLDSAHLPRSPKKTDSSPKFVLAIATSLLIGLALGWTLRGMPEVAKTSEGSDQDAKLPLVNSATSKPFVPLIKTASSSAQIESSAHDTSSYYAEEFYLCGVGTIHSKSLYQVLRTEK